MESHRGISLNEKNEALDQISNVPNTKTAKVTGPDNTASESSDFFQANIDIDTIRIERNKADAKLNAEKIKKRSDEIIKLIVLHPNSVKFEHVIIGAGIASTNVYAQLPVNLRKKKDGNIPCVIVLNNQDNPNQWHKDGQTLMGQDPNVLVPQFLSIRPEDYMLDENRTQRNPYNYTMASDFNDALIATQCDLEMPIVNLYARKIETYSDNKNKNWKDPAYPLRILIEYNGIDFFLYTKHIDLCIGPGASRKLNQNQISPALEKELLADEKLIYGQDNSDVKLHGEVLFYGGGARCAAMILDIYSGYHPHAKAPYWIAAEARNLREVKTLNRMYAELHDSGQIKMAVGNLDMIEKTVDGKIKVKFTASVDKDKTGQYADLEGKTIVCDKLVVATGQQRSDLEINSDLKDFEICYYENEIDNNQRQQIPLGTHSKDGSIIAWGAAGGSGVGLSTKDRETVRTQIRRHTQTLPSESQAYVGIFHSSWAIENMADLMRKKKMFPEYDSPKDDARRIKFHELNKVTRSELIQFIRFQYDKSVSDVTCDQYADNILAIRAKQPLGVLNLDVLKGHIPDELIDALRCKYFPFESPKLSRPKIKVHESAHVFFQEAKRNSPLLSRAKTNASVTPVPQK